MSDAGKIRSEFSVNKAKEIPFTGDGLRAYRAYRDLGAAGATDGRVHAQIIRTTEPCPEGGTGKHYHELEFQMVYCLNGRSRVWFGGQGELKFEAGDCWVQPPGIHHTVLEYSDDYELL